MFARRESLKQYIAWYPVTSVIIVIHLILWGSMEIAGSSEDGMTLIRFGALFGAPGLEAEWWRYVTAMFLHIGFTHLLFNSFALYVFAPPLEIMLGKWRYIVLYLVCGVIGNLVSAWLRTEFISAGASGAIYGIYGAYLFLAFFRKDIIDRQTKQTVITLLIVGFVYSVLPGVDLYAHAGGFAGGLLTMAVIALSIRRRTRNRTIHEDY